MPLVLSQLGLAAALPLDTPAWILARVCAGLAALAQLRAGRLSKLARTAALAAGAGPTIQLLLFPEIGWNWHDTAGIAALLLLPQPLLSNTDRAVPSNP